MFWRNGLADGSRRGGRLGPCISGGAEAATISAETAHETAAAPRHLGLDDRAAPIICIVLLLNYGRDTERQQYWTRGAKVSASSRPLRQAASGRCGQRQMLRGLFMRTDRVLPATSNSDRARRVLLALT